MWTCPKCKEQIGDEFDSCWKCAVAAQPPTSSQKPRKPLEQFENICLVIAFLPGFIFVMRGHAQNSAQALFRIVTIIVSFIIGIGGYVAIKIYQRAKMEGPK